MVREFSRKSTIVFQPNRQEIKKQRSIHQKLFFGALFLIILLSVFYGLFFLPFLRFNKLEIVLDNPFASVLLLEQAQNRVQEFFTKRYFFIKRDNMLIFSEKEIRNLLFADFPEISNIKIDKNLGDRSLKIYLSKREIAAIWCKTNPLSVLSADLNIEIKDEQNKEEIKNCFYVDKNGIIFKEAPLTFGALIILIKDFSEKEILVGQKIAEPKLIKFMSDFKNLTMDNTQFTVNEFIIGETDSQLKAISAEGWRIIFNDTQTAETQSLIIKKILEDEIKNKRKDLEYIDLRLENKVYYKFHD